MLAPVAVTATVLGIVAASATVLALVGCAYMLAAALLVGRWRGAVPRPTETPPVLLLKPLHGGEPDLARRLEACLAQDYPAPLTMFCGVSDAADPAADAARALIGRGLPVTLVVDPTRHGANAKVSNLANMAARRPPLPADAIVVLSDDDIVVPHDYLARIAAALAAPGVGCVTCAYAGLGDAGFWSRQAAAGISWQFLPNLTIGLAAGLARPCMGSTIAMRAGTLDAIGGFAPFADLLADDHAIGEAVRALGLAVVVPPMLVLHACTERNAAALVAHEVRWHATVRRLDPWGYAGSVVTYPLAFAIVAAAAGGGWWPAAAALASRLILAIRVDRLAGRRTAPLWTLPLRDIVGFVTFLGGAVARSVDWRGQSLSLAPGGRVSAGRRHSR